MIQVIAHGLEIGHPIAYCIIFLMLGIPLLTVILLGWDLVIDALREKRKNKQAVYHSTSLSSISKLNPS